MLLYAAPMPTSFGAIAVESEMIATTGTDDYGTLTLTRAQNLVEAGERYEVTSMFSIADAQALRTAGTDYPQWVTENFLDMPGSITPRTVETAELLAAGNTNPYDTAKAIESFVRTTITYNESVPQPPRGVEPVDYTLFERPEGYCNYYASSMAVLLRTVGIPARVVAGFSQGEYDTELGAYTVLESNAHTWVEVYFPNYGWVPFEPTAAEDPIFRPEGDTNPEPTPTPNQQAPNVPESEQQPTPTPEQDDELPAASLGGQGSGISQALLGALRLIWWGAVAFILGGGGLLGLWFWFEQRGMQGLSDVSRSYARMNAYAGLTGIQPEPAHTPYERARQIVNDLPEVEKPVYSIVRLYVEEQYNPNTHMTRDRLRLRQKAQNAWREARLTFIKQAIKRRVDRLLRRS
jgi:transglutaminase-like putative cysteine protease